MKTELPVLLISNGVLLPGADLKIPIKNRNNILTLEKYLTKSAGHQNQVVIAYRLSDEKVFEVATVACVDKIFGWSFNNVVQYSINVVGLHRVRVEKLTLPTAIVTKIEEPEENLTESTLETLQNIAKTLASNVVNARLDELIEDRDYGRLVDLCAAQIKQNDVGYAQFLEFLSTIDVTKRVDVLNTWMTKKFEPMGLKIETRKLEENRGRRGFEAKQIGKPKNSVEIVEEKLRALKFMENVETRVFSELSRLKSLNSSQSEYNVVLNWLELVASLPWNASSVDAIDIAKARRDLDASHDAMRDVKQRILEHLAVCQWRQNTSRGDGDVVAAGGSILCLTGPPGIGKTSIAKAIAAATGRRFARISLGGCRDESDIRGHRRTYVAAMPGRVVEAMKQCATNNPVILLDEVDKLYAGNQGSPSGALLELMDGEQNKEFHDHYLNLPLDVSKVMFIATANDVARIEPALRDRLEIIEMSGYTQKEKVRICQRHLLPRQLSQHCISPDYVHVDERAVWTMIEEYTMEAGVRQLERNVAAICRNVALRLAEALNSTIDADTMPDFALPINIGDAEIHEILRHKTSRRVRIVERMSPLPPGTVFGLSVAGHGDGRVMPIEVVKTATTAARDAKCVTTGSLGKVLEESIVVARGWLAANATRLGIADLKTDDVHVHLPAGSINKDGPSAGCGLACALVSLATATPCRSDTAITGELSLTGHTLPIGGVKEKVLAAQRDGLRRVILPRANVEDVARLDGDVVASLDIVLVDRVDEAIEAMLEKTPVLAKL